MMDMMYTFVQQNRAYNNLNKKMIIQVDTITNLTNYVNQESKDNKKHSYNFKQNITC